MGLLTQALALVGGPETTGPGPVLWLFRIPRCWTRGRGACVLGQQVAILARWSWSGAENSRPSLDDVTEVSRRRLGARRRPG